MRIFYFRSFSPKWFFSKLLVVKVDLCIEVVALIKITTVLDKTCNTTKTRLMEWLIN